ncbi:MAG: purine-nucleoside phosphorylase [Candidatus Izemoplasmatales bacterium]
MEKNQEISYQEKLNTAFQYLQKTLLLKPEILLILGSGLGGFTDHLSIIQTVPFSAIPYFPTTQVVGHQSTLVLAKYLETPLLIMKGRNHYYQGFTDEEMRLPLQLFALLGVNKLINTNACGGMNPTFQPGDIMLIEDHINMMGRNPLNGDNLDSIGPRFFDMSEPYDQKWIQMVQKIAVNHKILLQKGVYVSYFGPNYETKAEIKAFRQLGGDAVGMSTVPEVLVARHAGMRVLGLSVITNMSTGLSEKQLSHDEVIEVSSRVSKNLSTLLQEFIKHINNS